MRKKFWFRLSCAVIIIFLIFIGHSAISIWSFSNQVQYVKTDAAVVLGAAVWGNEPSPVFRERINHAIWLYKNDYVDKIIFTGGKSKGDEFAESEAAREYAIQNDVNEEDIFIETKSKITEENLKYAYEIANENHLKSFTIVSDPLHMKRALFIAETIGMEAYSSPTPSSVYKTFGSKLPFFLRELFYYVGYIVTLPFR
ncbi:YdcF family protein [Sinanaerobacter chloroacetimidivorans]|jgi:uncharacterized SAM-binding protein YcdF (DUF218 family)|uniref:YdcF family protein n=1 Tax=Sinanaerobacter chloroacetimidivorans TaxID=2818044 RepID=A0A8J8B1G0_9FIRM|nr:YdcF family protein [Sinanaerobacter chloroacetimidivorans]MBR0597626.1 YdcF family protein [Sinanaerobacter chloroacetimidivorans]